MKILRGNLLCITSHGRFLVLQSMLVLIHFPPTHIFTDGGRDCQTNVSSVRTPPAICTTFLPIAHLSLRDTHGAILQHPTGHRWRSRGGGGGVPPPPRFFFLGRPPSIFESLKNIYSYICILNTMKVIQSV